MNTPSGSPPERVLADFAERYGALTRVGEQLRRLSVTARSRDDVVEATVDADGCPTGIRFVDRRFREMAAPELGDSVREALTTAQTELSSRATALMTAANVRPLLWGPGLQGTGSASPLAPLPAELREAVTALRDFVCDAVSNYRAPS
ncbi:YbaB/EbfC family nucleoid-associated protein [Streptomyces sp. NPDC005480]|uniref:YbaB/EbfC family nucleoid-associated protein n=1 Tax=Streptomyces sp. NPDC005480 TaxID=3154880 RepID=UPI0033A2B20A